MAQRRQQNTTTAGRLAALAVLMVASVALGAGSAEGKPTAPEMMTLKVKWEAMPPLTELPPGAITEGRAFYGTLNSTHSSCRTGRDVFALYEFPPYGKVTPLVRPMWGGGEGRIRTDGSGAWKAEPVVFARQAYRITAFVKTKRLGNVLCPRVESKPLVIPAQMPPEV